MLPTDPAWIGAWWLGYVLFGAILLVLIIPMFFYPKHIKQAMLKKQEADAEQTLVQQIKGEIKVRSMQ